MNDFVSIKMEGPTRETSRGWYICVHSDGYEYLYSNGVVGHGVSDNSIEASAFWETEQKAKDFYENWRS